MSKRGPKPKYAEPTVPKMTRMPVSLAAEIEEEARAKGCPVSEVMIARLRTRGEQ